MMGKNEILSVVVIFVVGVGLGIGGIYLYQKYTIDTSISEEKLELERLKAQHETLQTAYDDALTQRDTVVAEKEKEIAEALTQVDEIMDANAILEREVGYLENQITEKDDQLTIAKAELETLPIDEVAKRAAFGLNILYDLMPPAQYVPLKQGQYRANESAIRGTAMAITDVEGFWAIRRDLEKQKANLFTEVQNYQTAVLKMSTAYKAAEVKYVEEKTAHAAAQKLLENRDETIISQDTIIHQQERKLFWGKVKVAGAVAAGLAGGYFIRDLTKK